MNLSAYKRALTLLESWLEDQQFYEENPYQWMRPGMDWLGIDFLSKCNYCYTVDTVYHYVKSAVESLEKLYPTMPSGYPYYRALINAAANSLVVGK